LSRFVQWYRRTLRPRLVFVPFWLMRLVPIPFGRGRPRRARGPGGPRLCIEAGVRGWESIEFKELYATACEFLGKDRVDRLVVDRESPYPQQVARALDEIRPTHYLYDPRTGDQGVWGGLREAFRIGLMLHMRGIVPVVLLTDLAVRTWRAQSAVVSARRGLVVAFIAAREIAPIFPHRRLLAPSVMPLSQRTAAFLDELGAARPEEDPPKAVFVGSLYEPRTTTLGEIAAGLAERGHALDIRGRTLGSPRVSDREYWSRLVDATIVVTTADQLVAEHADWTWISHLVYRYIEVLACGTLLVAPDVPGVRRYFTPGEHFVSFQTVAEAVDRIAHYLTHPVERQAIARRGRERARAILAARTFWTNVDTALGPDSLT
jgi:glycosyltransferase involved in cell wall biosynthesis